MNKKRKNPLIQNYTGVYGIHFDDKEKKILLIKKARGPYTGMYDLPGGGIEKGETHSETLLREFIEEVGCEVQTYNFLHQDHYECPYVGSTGIERDFKHTGFYFSVSLTVRAEIKSEPDGQDSLGAEYIELKNIVSDNVVVAPMARKAILFLANQKNLV